MLDETLYVKGVPELDEAIAVEDYAEIIEQPLKTVIEEIERKILRGVFYQGRWFVEAPPFCESKLKRIRQLRSKNGTVTKYYIAGESCEEGPYTLYQLRQMWAHGRLNLSSEFRLDGIPEWESIENIVDLLEEQHEPETLEPRPSASQRDYSIRFSKKSNLLAGCLGFLLGPVGLWYKGQWSAGFAWLTMTILISIATGGIAAPICWIGMGIHAIVAKPK